MAAAPPTALMKAKTARAYIGDQCSQISPDTMPMRKPKRMLGMFIMPFDMASGTGKVNSTAKALLTGAAGIPAKPMNAVFNEKSHTFPVGKVKFAASREQTDSMAVAKRVSLNRWYLSSKMEMTMVPITPQTMNTVPRRALSFPV